MFDIDEEERISPWKIDYPIGRLEYFKFIIFLILAALLLKFISDVLPICKSAPIAFTFVLILIYLNFVATAKRLYSIIGELKPAVITTIIAILVSAIIPILSSILLLVLLFVPGNEKKV